MDGCRKSLRQETKKTIKIYKNDNLDKSSTFFEIISCYRDIIYYAKLTASRLIHWKGQNDTIENPGIMMMNEDRSIRSNPIRTSFDMVSPKWKRSSTSSTVQCSIDNTIKFNKTNKVVPLFVIEK